MQPWLKALAVVLTAFLGVSPAIADQHGKGPARTGLEVFGAGLDSLHAAFEQTITGPDGRVESTGEGEVWLARPGRLRWSYEGDFPELIIADGERVWMHDEMLEQVTVKPQSTLAGDSPLTLLTDLAALDERFRTRELGEFDGINLLELVSVSEESEFKRVLLGLSADELRLMVMEDAFGLRTELRFRDIERNPSVSPEQFEFVPPPGVDVVGDTGE
jgi:outer membrane lipoprotein carrier protein